MIEKNKKKKLTRTQKILNLLIKYDEIGLTARELAYKLNYTERNATHPRLTKLVKSGQVIKIGRKRDNITKRLATVYKISHKES